MSYKFIRTFGTSYTEGGGFHYWIDKRIKTLYKGLSPMIDNTMFEFSWPSFLQKKVKPKVINHALSGYGNDRIFREVYKVVESDDFKSSEHLFLFELSALGREEFYSNEIGDWGIINYQVNWDNTLPIKNGFGMAFNYHNQNNTRKSIKEAKKEDRWIDENIEIFEQYILKTISVDNQLQTLIRKLKMFFSYCDASNLNWYIVADECMFISRPELRKWINKFLGDKDYIGIFQYAGEDITEETNECVVDGHFGIYANQTIGLYLAKKLNEIGEIDELLEYNTLDKDYVKDTISKNAKNLKGNFEKDLI